MSKKEEIVYTEGYCPYNRKILLEKIKSSMSEKRYIHVLGVEEMAIKLARKYRVNVEKASVAALTHDYAKERPDEEMKSVIKEEGFSPELFEYGNPIWHGVLGSFLVAKELYIKDEEILQAIALHTTGAKEMTELDKVIYVADYIEKGRFFPGVEEARNVAFENLDKAVAFETKETLLHLIKSEVKVYPKTLETYNKWVVNQ